MKINRSALVKGLPTAFEGNIVSIQPIDNTRLLMVEIDYEGLDIKVPLDKECVASLLSAKVVVTPDPGEEIPKYTRRSASSPRIGPKVGTEKVMKGVKKKLIKYDFVTPRLKGKRRVACPDTGRKGFPVWERV